MSGRLAFFRITSLLSPVGSPQTDDADVLPTRGNYRGMESAVDEPEHPDPALTVVCTGILDTECALEVHVSEPFEADAALTNIARVLRRVELDRHDYIVYTIKSKLAIALSNFRERVVGAATRAGVSHQDAALDEIEDVAQGGV